jgi:hypothetical protein
VVAVQSMSVSNIYDNDNYDKPRSYLCFIPLYIELELKTCFNFLDFAVHFRIQMLHLQAVTILF